jgi:hypothetical protein
VVGGHYNPTSDHNEITNNSIIRPWLNHDNETAPAADSMEAGDVLVVFMPNTPSTTTVVPLLSDPPASNDDVMVSLNSIEGGGVPEPKVSIVSLLLPENPAGGGVPMNSVVIVSLLNPSSAGGGGGPDVTMDSVEFPKMPSIGGVGGGPEPAPGGGATGGLTQ